MQAIYGRTQRRKNAINTNTVLRVTFPTISAIVHLTLYLSVSPQETQLQLSMSFFSPQFLQTLYFSLPITPSAYNTISIAHFGNGFNNCLGNPSAQKGSAERESALQG